MSGLIVLIVMSTPIAAPVVPAVHRVHGLATVSAIVSSIGLVVFNLLGLVLSIVALRQMDRAPVRFHGYRMVFTGWFMGVLGLTAYPIFLTRAYKAYEAGSYAGPFAMVVAVMVMAPIFMILYAWQDRLPEAQTFEGYAWLGHQGKSHRLDLLGLTLVAAGALMIAKIGPGNLATGIAFVIVGLAGPIFKRRGMRMLLLYLLLTYLLNVAFAWALN
jgi:hypothetical protein